MPLLKPEPDTWPADLFEDEGATNRHLGQWWAAYTRSRQEKSLARHLAASRVAHYLPQRSHSLRAGDRLRTAYVPLFTAYVFILGGAEERLTALRSNAILKMIDPPDQGQLERELRSLWLLQKTGEPLVVHPNVQLGETVEVTGGALKGYRGIVRRVKGGYRLVVSITLLRQSVSIELDRGRLAPVQQRPRTAGSRPLTVPIEREA